MNRLRRWLRERHYRRHVAPATWPAASAQPGDLLYLQIQTNHGTRQFSSVYPEGWTPIIEHHEYNQPVDCGAEVTSKPPIRCMEPKGHAGHHSAWTTGGAWPK